MVFKKGQKAWNKGKKCPQLSKALKGHKGYWKGKKRNQTMCKKMSIINQGSNHPNWKGGITPNPYGPKFSETLKKQIRIRDNFKCQECFRHQSELKFKLSVHHIDFNKQNNNPNNLISLCHVCHGQTTWNREHWIEYYKQRVKE